MRGAARRAVDYREAGQTRHAMKTVLAPVDFSSITQRVVEEAAVLSRVAGARLVLLNVVPPPPMMASEFAANDVAVHVLEGAKRTAIARLARLRTQLAARGITAHAFHVVGLPGPRITEQAERLEADLIVIGSHGHGSIYNLLVGSTTTRVLQTASCPVVVVPPAKGAVHAGDVPATETREWVEIG
jgi:nucleotide-binding universal stress UspA family protein